MRSALLFIACATVLRAQLVSEALSTFPQQTESVEYHSLSAVPLDSHTKAALNKLGMEEDQPTDLIVGVSKGVRYGLLTGTFSGKKVAARKSINPLKLEDHALYCPGGGACFLFLEDWLIAFGTTDQLAAMLQVRQGLSPSLRAKTRMAEMLSATDESAPVRGIAPPNQVSSLMPSGIPGGLLEKLGFDVDLLAYSVSMDKLTRVKAALDCKTKLSAAALEQTLFAVSRMQQQFANLDVSLSDTTVNLSIDLAAENQ
jgi:hypothetical protein